MEKYTFCKFSFNLDEMANFCRIKPDTETATSTKKSNDYRQQEISNTYELDGDSNLQLVQKHVHEVITPQDTPQYDEYKTDLVKLLLVTLLSGKKDDILPFNMCTLMLLETFEQYNFLTINEDENDLTNETNK